ncbi:Rieske 2Fe-2S domain-containing protein [Mycobacterium sp. DL440]|uniref:Rieske 2Fe-2S domain-containing protein n=1 Tax=Mycobacterium sp. DL440 TaxID=2675523 RepID=UPI001420318C|nr:Rieske 2Fe-2S domain-containing protein [Mycobacterium sp. DL440]
MTTTQLDDDHIRHIEAAALPQRFARGWHCLGLSKHFEGGKPQAVAAFGQRLVVFRDRAGVLQVLDAYCRHMGGDLSEGEVKGDEVACPFHDWRWGGDGRCKAVPYSKRTPRLARTARWQTMEQDGMVFVWNDPEGNPPSADVAIPRIPGAGTGGWTDWYWHSTVIETNCREIVDNLVDMAHFFYIHGSVPDQFKNIFEGHVATQFMSSGIRQDFAADTDAPMMLGTTSVASYWGPSFMIDDLTYHLEHGDQKTVLLNCHYPIDANSFVLQYGIIVEKSPLVPDEQAAATAVALGDWVKKGFDEDIEIWRNKARIDNPLLCEEDGPVYQLRRWYEQFYVDIADVTPDMVDRFEFEVDVTHPREVWTQHMAAGEAVPALG